MSIRFKVVLLLGVSMALALFISVLAILGANRVLGRAMQFSDSTQVNIALARTLADATTTIKADPIAPETGPLLKRVNKDVLGNLASAGKRIGKNADPELLKALEQARKDWIDYDKQSMRLFKMAETDPAAAIGMVESVYQSKFLPFQKDLNQVIELGLKHGSGLEAAIEDSIHSQRQSILIPLAVTFLILAGLVIAFMSTLTQAVGRFLKHSEHLSDGDLTVRFAERGRDEINRIGHAVNRFLDPFVRTLTGVRHAVDESDRVIGQLGRVMDKTERQMVIQDNETAQMVTAVEQLSGSFREVAEKAANASTSAEQGELIVRKGTETGHETIAALKSIDEAVTSTGEMMTQLDKAITEVANVTKVIQGISEQTTLLALNAAIEAARAGIQGRGFAVVADEVKQLSDRTKASTVDITNIVQTVQASTRNVRDTLDQAHDAVTRGVDSGESMGALLNEIDASMNAVADMLRDIATSTEEQSAVTVDIAHRIEHVSAGSHQMREQMGSISEVMTDLGRASHQLHDYLDAFKISGDQASPTMAQAMPEPLDLDKYRHGTSADRSADRSPYSWRGATMD